MEVDVGIVTGRNEFFMLNKEQIGQWKLKKYLKQVVGKSNHLQGLSFNENDFESITNSNRNVHLFYPPDREYSKLPKIPREYIDFGEMNNFNKGYKCRIRKRWYITPSIRIPDAFALRQVNGYPKLIVNETSASSTDTIHRVKITSNHSPYLIALSYINSLTFAFSEITGRSYGGGVLTFEPTEIEELPLPIDDRLTVDFNQIDLLIRNDRIIEVLDIMDRRLLIDLWGFSSDEVEILRGIWQKLSSRRTNRK